MRLRSDHRSKCAAGEPLHEAGLGTSGEGDISRHPQCARATFLPFLWAWSGACVSGLPELTGSHRKLLALTPSDGKV